MRHIATRGSVPAIHIGTGAPAKRVLARAWVYLEAAWQVRRERHDLARLDEHLLKDIGMSRSLAAREAGRDFLDVPAHRIRRR